MPLALQLRPKPGLGNQLADYPKTRRDKRNGRRERDQADKGDIKDRLTAGQREGTADGGDPAVDTGEGGLAAQDASGLPESDLQTGSRGQRADDVSRPGGLDKLKKVYQPGQADNPATFADDGRGEETGKGHGNHSLLFWLTVIRLCKVSPGSDWEMAVCTGG